MSRVTEETKKDLPESVQAALGDLVGAAKKGPGRPSRSALVSASCTSC